MTIDKSARGMLAEFRRDLNLLNRRLGKGVISGLGRGTTAQRDVLYPPPSNTAEQVDLANTQVSWMNTDTGWTESYYAPTGSAGLTAKGLVPGVAAGWYPVGVGPSISMVPTAVFNGTSGQPVRGWGTLGSGYSRRNGGSEWLTYDNTTGRITMVKAGVYDIYAKSIITTGSGSFSAGLMLGNPASAINVLDTYYTLSSTLFTSLQDSHLGWVAQAGHVTYVQQFNGTVGWHMRANLAANIGGQFSVKYTGPPLVTD